MGNIMGYVSKPGYEIDNEPQKYKGLYDNLYTAKKPNQSPKSLVSIFVHEANKSNENKTKLIQNGITNLMRLRHPIFIKFIESKQDKKGEAIVHYVITEHVKTLDSVLDKMTLTIKLLGLYEIITGLKFLHENEISHNNLKVSSIFVCYSEEGISFKLGAVEYAQKISQITKEDIKNMDQDILPPEDKTEGSFVSKKVDSRDIWSLHLILKEMFKEVSNNKISELLNQMIESCSNVNASQRPSAAQLLKHTLFSSSNFIQTITTLTTLTTMEENSKNAFFKDLIVKLKELTMEEIKEYIFPKLLSSETLREIHVHQFLPFLFAPKDDNPKALLSKKEYETTIIPFIVSQFEEKERNVRVTMLKQFQTYIPYLPPNTLKNNIVPKILEGLNDKENFLVFNTLDSLPVLFQYLYDSDQGYLYNLLSFSLINVFVKLILYDPNVPVRIYTMKTMSQVWKVAPKVVTEYENNNPNPNQNTVPLKNTILDIYDRCLSHNNHEIRLSALVCFTIIEDVVDIDLSVKELITLSVPLLLDPNEQVREQANSTITSLLAANQRKIISPKQLKAIPMSPQGEQVHQRRDVFKGSILKQDHQDVYSSLGSTPSKSFSPNNKSEQRTTERSFETSRLRNDTPSSSSKKKTPPLPRKKNEPKKPNWKRDEDKFDDTWTDHFGLDDEEDNRKKTSSFDNSSSKKLDRSSNDFDHSEAKVTPIRDTQSKRESPKREEKNSVKSEKKEKKEKLSVIKDESLQDDWNEEGTDDWDDWGDKEDKEDNQTNQKQPKEEDEELSLSPQLSFTKPETHDIKPKETKPKNSSKNQPKNESSEKSSERETESWYDNFDEEPLQDEIPPTHHSRDREDSFDSNTVTQTLNKNSSDDNSVTSSKSTVIKSPIEISPPNEESFDTSVKINDLDLQPQSAFNFFEGMEPVITKQKKHEVVAKKPTLLSSALSDDKDEDDKEDWDDLGDWDDNKQENEEDINLDEDVPKSSDNLKEDDDELFFLDQEKLKKKKEEEEKLKQAKLEQERLQREEQERKRREELQKKMEIQRKQEEERLRVQKENEEKQRQEEERLKKEREEQEKQKKEEDEGFDDDIFFGAETKKPTLPTKKATPTKKSTPSKKPKKKLATVITSTSDDFDLKTWKLCCYSAKHPSS